MLFHRASIAWLHERQLYFTTVLHLVAYGTNQIVVLTRMIS